MTIPWVELVVAGLTAILMWGMGWVRTYLARRIAVSTPVERKVKKLSGTVRRQSLLLDAVADRQAMQSQGIIILANAVKLGDQAQVTRSLDIVTAGENQYLAFLTSHMKDDDDEEADE